MRGEVRAVSITFIYLVTFYIVKENQSVKFLTAKVSSSTTYQINLSVCLFVCLFVPTLKFLF